MNVHEYEVVVRDTNNYGTSREDFLAMIVALAGEVGEFCNRAKRFTYVNRDTPEELEALRGMHDELGDILYYTTDLVHLLGATLENVLHANADKVRSRRAAGTTYNLPKDTLKD
ncbi:MazG nucleotide pyrophosphohydrolase domain-containing protein [Chromatium okenii]|uniref:MazG nucleotide pyrophosphohydrolase domain-containing protein n=1 Tax=Chromatium okenii TaxID=61644 RepID=UPI0026EB4F47|nr:MazG nucleotide pyrophosphohydrolase domain-containing protein [Chromatium okenii]